MDSIKIIELDEYVKLEILLDSNCLYKDLIIGPEHAVRGLYVSSLISSGTLFIPALIYFNELDLINKKLRPKFKTVPEEAVK